MVKLLTVYSKSFNENDIDILHTYSIHASLSIYELEFQWMACTISLLHKSVNLVSVHSLGTLGLGLVDITIDTSHPFLRPVFLSLELPQEFRNHLESKSIKDEL